MTVGWATARASNVLNVYRNTAYAAISSVYVKLHTGDPGAAGTANASAETTRKLLSFAAPSSNAIVASAVTWSAWSGGSATLTHFSLWDASTSGNFLESGTINSGTGFAVVNGNDVNLTVTVSATPIAA